MVQSEQLLPADEAMQESAQVCVHVDEHPDAQAVHVVPAVPPVQLPVHDEVQLSMQAASQPSQPSEPHDVRALRNVGAAMTAPNIGNNPLAAFLKNRLRFISSLLFISHYSKISTF